MYKIKFKNGTEMDYKLLNIINRLEKNYSYNDVCKAMDFILNFSGEFTVSPTPAEKNTAEKALIALETTPLGFEDLPHSLPYKAAIGLLKNFRDKRK